MRHRQIGRAVQDIDEGYAVPDHPQRSNRRQPGLNNGRRERRRQDQDAKRYFIKTDVGHTLRKIPAIPREQGKADQPCGDEYERHDVIAQVSALQQAGQPASQHIQSVQCAIVQEGGSPAPGKARKSGTKPIARREQSSADRQSRNTQEERRIHPMPQRQRNIGRLADRRGSRGVDQRRTDDGRKDAEKQTQPCQGQNPGPHAGGRLMGRLGGLSSLSPEGSQAGGRGDEDKRQPGKHDRRRDPWTKFETDLIGHFLG